MANFVYGLERVVFSNSDTGIPIAASGAGSSFSFSEGRTINLLRDNTGRPRDFALGESDPKVNIKLREFFFGFPFITDENNAGLSAKASSFSYNTRAIANASSAILSGITTTVQANETLIPGVYLLYATSATAVNIYEIAAKGGSTLNTPADFVVATGTKTPGTELTINTTRGFNVVVGSSISLVEGASVEIEIFDRANIYVKTDLSTDNLGQPMAVHALSRETGQGGLVRINLHKVVFNSFPEMMTEYMAQSEFEIEGTPLIPSGLNSTGSIQYLKDTA